MESYGPEKEASSSAGDLVLDQVILKAWVHTPRLLHLPFLPLIA